MNDKQISIEENLGLVYFLVQKYYPAFANDEDIIQCGMVGLCEAYKRWNGNSKFSYYAKEWILGEIKRELRDRSKHSVEVSLDKLLEEDKNESY